MVKSHLRLVRTNGHEGHEDPVDVQVRRVNCRTRMWRSSTFKYLQFSLFGQSSTSTLAFLKEWARTQLQSLWKVRGLNFGLLDGLQVWRNGNLENEEARADLVWPTYFQFIIVLPIQLPSVLWLFASRLFLSQNRLAASCTAVAISRTLSNPSNWLLLLVTTTW